MFPALAVAEALRARDPQVRLTFVGGGGRLERRLAEQAGCRYLAISAEPTPRSAWKAWRFVRERFDESQPRLRFTIDIESGLIRAVETSVRRPGVGVDEVRDRYGD